MNYIANTPAQQREMLDVCGAPSIATLFDPIPKDLRVDSLHLPEGRSEFEVLEYFRRVAGRNTGPLTLFLGGGVYDHYIPAAVDALAGRSEFFTAYTPYQPEVSQGTLQAIYEYQSSICRLTGMEVSNASLYDGGTALCEACQMAIQATGRKRIVMDGGINPVYRTMIRTYTANLSIGLEEIPATVDQDSRPLLLAAVGDDTAAVILQNPSFFGVIDDHSDIVAACHAKGALVIQSVYPIAMSVCKTPGEMGVDIVTGEGQSLGIPLSFGGPYLGFMATTRALVRKMPGRLVGRTLDRDGKEAFVLTLQAREQHIRREKATSNICTNQALCALRAHIYLSLMGSAGLREVAELCIAKTRYAMQRLSQIPGVEVDMSRPVFNEFTLKLPVDAAELVNKLIERGIAPGLPLGRFYPGMDRVLLVAVTEKRSRYDIGMMAEMMETILHQECFQ